MQSTKCFRTFCSGLKRFRVQFNGYGNVRKKFFRNPNSYLLQTRRYLSEKKDIFDRVKAEQETNDAILTEISKRLNNDKSLTDRLVEQLSHDMKLRVANKILDSKLNGKEYSSFISGRHRRAIAVREVSMSLGDMNFGKADKDGDGQVTSEELDAWLKNVAKVRNDTKEKETISEKLQLSPLQTRRLLLISCIPFIGFGFLDNAIMIVAGDLIEANFGVLLGLSTLAAAGLGNLLSDIFGLAFGDVVEKWARRLGVKDPKLTLKQMSLPQTKRLQLFGSSVGITIGCLLGMLPLLFM